MTVTSRAPASGTGRAATSGVQEALWFLHQLEPASTAYHTSRGFHVAGPLDLAALKAAWHDVLARHAVLRTTFADGHGGLTASVVDTQPDSFRVVDLTGKDATPWQLDRLCAAAAGAAFDLRTGPPARLTVLRCGPDEHRVVFVAHEIVADPVSASVILDELAAAYAGAWHDPVRPRDLAPLSGDGPAGVEFWTRWLTPAPPPLELPTDRARPTGPSPGGDVVRFSWPGIPCGRLTDVAAAEVVLLAAFQVLLHRYTGEDRIAVGVPMNLRAPGADRAVGPLRNLVVVCADLDDRPTFRDLVRRSAAAVRQADERRAAPFHEVVRALAVDRDPRRIPLCDTMFVAGEAESTLDLKGLTVEPVAVHARGARADLTLTIERTAPSIAGSLEFRTSLFDRASIVRMLDQLRALLCDALDKPDRTVDALALAGPAQAHAAVRATNEIPAAVPVDGPVHEVVRRLARQRPNAVAVSWAGRATSYRDLWTRAEAIAAAIGQVDSAPVVVRMSPGPDQIAALVAVMAAGAHLVWLATGDTGERGRAVLADVRPACLVLDGEPDDDALAGWYRDELGGRIVSVARIAAPARHDDNGGGPVRRVSLETRAYVAHTSGSTGRPKGIGQSHEALAQFVGWMAGRFGIGPSSRWAQWVAPEHDPALCEVFATLVGGGTVCPVPERIRRNPDKLVDWLAEQRITVLQTVPSFARELWRALRDRRRTLPDLDRLLLMGEALPGDLVNGLRAALPTTRLANLYGPTETIAATWHEVTAEVRGTVPVGRPMPGRHVLVVDDRDEPCPAGVTGEIVIRSPFVTPGYLGAASGETTRFRSLAGQFEHGPGQFEHGPGQFEHGPGQPAPRTYRTGDLGRWRWDGALEFRGRKDFQVKLLGNRLELSDVEVALAEHDTVAECAVVALQDSDGLATGLVAYVVARPTPDGAVGSPEIWRAHLRSRFGRSILPVSFRAIDSRLPRNVGGKVDRRRLPDPGAVAAAPSTPPRTPTERGVVEIFSRVLGADGVAADTSFFAAGGGSLTVQTVLRQIKDRFDVEVSLWDFFANPTPASLATAIDASERTQSPQGNKQRADSE